MQDPKKEYLPAVLMEFSASEKSEDLFETIYCRYYKMVYSICLRMTHNRADAEDLAHDTFIQMYLNLSSFRGTSALKSWLYRIAVNQVLMRFRKKSIYNEILTEDGQLPDEVKFETCMATRISIIDHMALEGALAKLAPGYRSIFLLHDLTGYDHEEIAELLGITSGTSKSQLHKARMKLRSFLLKRVENRPIEAGFQVDKPCRPLF